MLQSMLLMTSFVGLVILLAVEAGAGGADAAKAPTVTTRPATPLGIDAMSVNGSIQPYGLATTYYFEYGPTTAYGSKTAMVPLPPRLAAFYRESWDENAGGWASWGVKGMEHHPQGGASAGFVRFEEPSRHDHNHDDAIGTVHLSKYVYPSVWGTVAKLPSLYLAAGDPDFRDARISIHVRGNNWVANGAELQWWSQSQSNIEIFDAAKVLSDAKWRHSNWAYTGFSLADLLRSGKWEKAEYRLNNDTDDWTYGGNNRTQKNPERYSYWSIDNVQRHLNVDFFHMVTFVDTKNPPTGSIDFDELEVAYRNYSLVLPSNGGKLVSAPPSADNVATLTDGWRHGKGKMWRSADNPTGPLDFVYSFKDPVTIRAVQLHQNPDWPAKDVEVLVSQDGTAFTSLCKNVLPEKGVPNANFAFSLDTGLSAKANFVKVRITSGYKKEHWGLGEIEVFGVGATMLPDDDLYHVNTDALKLTPGTTYHYRLVATNSAGTTQGNDMTFTVPAEQKPHVLTRSATRITATSATAQGRMSPLGLKTQFYFEYGPDTKYGSKTPETYGGLEITPRSVFAPLTGLKPATKYHYRLVAVNEKGTSVGHDESFVTKGP